MDSFRYNVTDRQTDGHTEMVKQQRAVHASSRWCAIKTKLTELADLQWTWIRLYTATSVDCVFAQTVSIHISCRS